jgi:hypothetical protein
LRQLTGDEGMKSKVLSLAMMLFLSLTLIMLDSEKTIAQVEQARFRVTLTGFVVNHESFDSALQIDGAGDEVFMLVNFAEIWSSNRIFGALQRRQSVVYGDTSGRAAFNLFPGLDHPGYVGTVHAGSAGRTGGLRTGDRYPPPGEQAATRPGAPEAARARLIPMILWEGDLRRGGPQQNAVVILPTIWETDYQTDLLNIWNRQVDNWIRRFATNSSQFVNGTTRRPLVEQADIVLRDIPQRNDFDRPIGMDGDTYNPVSATPEPATFIPAVMLLTFSSAQAAADSTTQGRGVVEITYRDGQNYGQGSYTIFLRVDRLP